MSIQVKGNHPLGEIIACKLFGIEGDYPASAKRRMVSTAARAAVTYHEEQIAGLQAQLADLRRAVWDEDTDCSHADTMSMLADMTCAYESASDVAQMYDDMKAQLAEAEKEVE